MAIVNGSFNNTLCLRPASSPHQTTPATQHPCEACQTKPPNNATTTCINCDLRSFCQSCYDEVHLLCRYVRTACLSWINEPNGVTIIIVLSVILCLRASWSVFLFAQASSGFVPSPLRHPQNIAQDSDATEFLAACFRRPDPDDPGAPLRPSANELIEFSFIKPSLFGSVDECPCGCSEHSL